MMVQPTYIKSLASDRQAQVPSHLLLNLVPHSSQSVSHIMYTVKAVVVVAVCATLIWAAPQRPSSGSDKDAVITSQQLEVNFDGNYVNNFETSNGIGHQETGQPKQVDQETPVVAQGSETWSAPDGQAISLTWTADENGFQAQGSHIPTAPPIPPEIQRALEYNAAHPEQDNEGDSGSRPPPRG